MWDHEYSDTADIETSSNSYARRFSGKTGEWFLTVQSDLIISMLKNLGCKTVLDVGGGHGQLTYPLLKSGFDVTVLGSSDTCAQRIKGFLNNNNKKCHFKEGSAVDIPFVNASFDVVISIRFLSHSLHWQKMIEELCRVAGHAVIVDYAPLRSFNILAPSFFRVKKILEGDTRKFRVLSANQVFNEFDRNKFQPEEILREFFLPMVLHRVIKSRHFSAFLESIFKRLFLTRLYGSPALLLAIRQGSPHASKHSKLTFWGFRRQTEKNIYTDGLDNAQ